MRTTLNIDDDILRVAKHLASRDKKSVGQVLSELARKALQPAARRTFRNGVPLLPVSTKAVPVTLDHIDQLRDGDELA